MSDVLLVLLYVVLICAGYSRGIRDAERAAERRLRERGES